MASLSPEDRISLCRFTFSDDRKCLTPRAPNHPHFCYFHARKESRSTSTDQLAQDLAYYFSGDYLSANDLSAALARLFPAVIRGDIKPRTARTLAYLSQTLIQTIHAAQFEYQQSQGVPAWRQAIHNSINQNFSHTNGRGPGSTSAPPQERTPAIPPPTASSSTSPLCHPENASPEGSAVPNKAGDAIRPSHVSGNKPDAPVNTTDDPALPSCVSNNERASSKNTRNTHVSPPQRSSAEPAIPVAPQPQPLTHRPIPDVIFR